MEGGAQSKFAQKIVDDYEAALAGEAERQGVDGVICGHIHKPGIRRIGSVLYCNDGDWVDRFAPLPASSCWEWQTQ